MLEVKRIGPQHDFSRIGRLPLQDVPAALFSLWEQPGISENRSARLEICHLLAKALLQHPLPAEGRGIGFNYYTGKFKNGLERQHLAASWCLVRYILDELPYNPGARIRVTPEYALTIAEKMLGQLLEFYRPAKIFHSLYMETLCDSSYWCKSVAHMFKAYPQEACQEFLEFLSSIPNLEICSTADAIDNDQAVFRQVSVKLAARRMEFARPYCSPPVPNGDRSSPAAAIMTLAYRTLQDMWTGVAPEHQQVAEDWARLARNLPSPQAVSDNVEQLMSHRAQTWCVLRLARSTAGLDSDTFIEYCSDGARDFNHYNVPNLTLRNAYLAEVVVPLLFSGGQLQSSLFYLVASSSDYFRTFILRMRDVDPQFVSRYIELMDRVRCESRLDVNLNFVSDRYARYFETADNRRAFKELASREVGAKQGNCALRVLAEIETFELDPDDYPVDLLATDAHEEAIATSCPDSWRELAATLIRQGLASLSEWGRFQRAIVQLGRRHFKSPTDRALLLVPAAQEDLKSGLTTLARELRCLKNYLHRTDAIFSLGAVYTVYRYYYFQKQPERFDQLLSRWRNFFVTTDLVALKPLEYSATGLECALLYGTFDRKPDLQRGRMASDSQLISVSADYAMRSEWAWADFVGNFGWMYRPNGGEFDYGTDLLNQDLFLEPPRNATAISTIAVAASKSRSGYFNPTAEQQEFIDNFFKCLDSLSEKQDPNRAREWGQPKPQRTSKETLMANLLAATATPAGDQKASYEALVEFIYMHQPQGYYASAVEYCDTFEERVLWIEESSSEAFEVISDDIAPKLAANNWLNRVFLPLWGGIRQQLRAEAAERLVPSAKAATKTLELGLRWDKGLMLLHSANFMHTCWGGYSGFHEGLDHPTLRLLAFLTKPGSPDVRPEGGLLVLEGNNVAGEKIWIIRGYNPSQGLLYKAWVPDLFDKVLNFVEVEASKAGVAAIALPRDTLPGLDLSNRVMAFLDLEQRFLIGPLRYVHLAPEHETTINKFEIWDRLVEIRRLNPFTN